MANSDELPTTPPGGKHNPSLTQKFAVAAGAIILLAAVFLVNIHQITTAAQTNRIAEETNGYVLQALSQGLLDEAIPLLDLNEPDRELAPTYPAYRRLDWAVRRILSGTPILKLKIYDDSGRVAYSTDPADLGQDYSKNERFLTALAGENVVRRQFREQFLAWSGPRQNVVLLAGYMPIRAGDDQGPAIGVIEIYRDITSLGEALNAAGLDTGLVMGGALALLFMLLLTFVWRAERKVKAEHLANLDLARAKAQAEAAAREKTQFVAGISHELRTPLNAIIGFAEILENEVNGPLGHQSHKEYVGDIRKAGGHLLNVINDVLDLVKLESGSFAVKSQPTDVIWLVNGVVRMLRPEADRFGNALELDAEGDIGEIETDPGRLRQILVNVTANGLKFTPEGGNVRIKLRMDEANGEVVFRVIDNGIGMCPEDIAIAEAPFGQVQNVLTRSREGTGLGLTLSRRFTEALGGTFRIESTPDVGTAITITLPRRHDTGSPPRVEDEPKEANDAPGSAASAA